MARRFDIVLWGCTGFTGGLVAEYFASSVPSHVSFVQQKTFTIC